MNKLFLKENIEFREDGGDSGFQLPSTRELPVNIETLGDSAPAETGQSKPASDFSGTTSNVRVADSFDVDGKMVTKNAAIQEIQKKVEEEVAKLQKALKQSLNFGGKFDAQQYQKDFDLLRKLTRFIEHFVSVIKNITLERIATLYRSVVIEKKEPDLNL